MTSTTSSSSRPASAASDAQEEQPTNWKGYGSAGIAVALSTVFSAFVFGRGELADVVMAYLLGVVLVSMRFGYGPSIAAAVLSVFCLDFFFVPPYLSFAVTDFHHIGTFAVMFVVGLVISRLTQRIRNQADTARHRELRTTRLYAMSRDLADTSSLDDLVQIAEKHVGEAFSAEINILLPDARSRQLVVASGDHHAKALALADKDNGVAEWVWAHGKPAGRGTDTLPSASARFLLLRGARAKVGVLLVRPKTDQSFVDPEQRQLLETFANQIASSIERVHFAEEAKRSEVEAEAERLRSALLSSVSHDLRTPLGVITGATSTLLQDEATLDQATRRDLLETAHEEAEHLNRLVRNLLDMTRLASGSIRPKKEWHPLDEIVGVALHRLEPRLHGRRKIDVKLAVDLPPIPLDDVLIEQVFINLLENAVKYSPADSPIEIIATAPTPSLVEVEIADRGPGVPLAERDHVFEKFYRLKREGSDGGAGLGLAICRGFVEAHGGRIWVLDRDGGGSSFHFTLPIEGALPVTTSTSSERD